MSLARNTIYNLAGAATTTLVTLASVPLFLHQIGDARYGVLAVVWLLLGYFGLFDLGLSRATAHFLARLRGASDATREEVFWTAALMNAALGLAGGVILYAVGNPLLSQWFKMSPDLHAEAVTALPWIAAAVPVATITAVLTGALTGQERFGALNILQVFGNTAFQLIPLLAAYAIGPGLEIVIPAAVVARAVSALPFAWVVRKTLKLWNRPNPSWARLRQLLGYGAWVSVTGIVSPILTSIDQFLIGAILGAASVSYYSVAMQVVGKLQVLPSALVQALFPRLSQRSDTNANVAEDSLLILNGLMTPVIVVMLFLMRPFLQLWVGADFAARAAPVGEILLLGIWINSLALVPFTHLQAQGRPDLVAKFHLAEAIPFVAGLWWALHQFGLIGAAYAWVVRVVVDAALLFAASRVPASALKRLVLSIVWLSFSWALVSFAPVRTTLWLIAAATIVLGNIAWTIHSNPILLRVATSVVKRMVRRYDKRHVATTSDE